ncbi:MAG: MarR family winged helix-turn-helix transcriptional regulator [Rhizobiaceae bacterium]
MNNFDLEDFLPYLLNRAAEQSSYGFQQIYKNHYGMLRMEWRVLFHLGRYGDMTARDICDRGGLHKTKVSRAVSALHKKRFVARKRQEEDRRSEMLSLTSKGKSVYRDLEKRAAEFHDTMTSGFTEKENRALISLLKRLASS